MRGAERETARTGRRAIALVLSAVVLPLAVGWVFVLRSVGSDDLRINVEATLFAFGLVVVGYVASLGIPYDFAARQARIAAEAQVLAEWRIAEFTSARELQTQFANELPKNVYLLLCMRRAVFEIEGMQPIAGESASELDSRRSLRRRERYDPIVAQWLSRPSYLALCAEVKSCFAGDRHIAANADVVSRLCGLLNEVGVRNAGPVRDRGWKVLQDVPEQRTRELAAQEFERLGCAEGTIEASPEDVAEALANAADTLLTETIPLLDGAIQRLRPHGATTSTRDPQEV